MFFNMLKKRGLDPMDRIESTFEDFLPEKVAKLMGDDTLIELIKSCLPQSNRTKLVLDVIEKICLKYENYSTQKKCDFIIRTTVAILTEGVVTAPIDGIHNIRIDPDNFLVVEVAGPIRAAGGSICATIILIAEYLRVKFNLNKYIPTKEEIERNVSEILAFIRKSPTQVRPSREELEYIMNHCPIMVDATETQMEEVPIHRFLKRIPKPRIRNGVPLILVEGFIVRARKLVPLTEQLGIENYWIKELITLGTKYRGTSGNRSSSTDSKYSLTIGRPLLSNLDDNRGLSVRFGTSPTVGICGSNVHPLLIDLLGFINIGSQLIISSPGKATTITGTCSDLRPPLVRYKDGVYHYIDGTKDSVLEILDLGQILFAVGDLIEGNKPLPPRDYCNGNFRQQVNFDKSIDLNTMTEQELFDLYKRVPTIKILPKFGLWLDNITYTQYVKLREIGLDISVKRTDVLTILNKLGVKYKIIGERIQILEKLIYEYYLARDLTISFDQYSELIHDSTIKRSNLIQYLNYKLTKAGRIRLCERGLYVITARLGRAQSISMTRLKPRNCHSLNQYKVTKNNQNFWSAIQKNPVEHNQYTLRFCQACNKECAYRKCEFGHETKITCFCITCNSYDTDLEKHKGHRVRNTIRLTRNYLEEVNQIKTILGDEYHVLDFKKNVKMMQTSKKMAYPQNLLKGVLRSVFDLPVTKDGTFRVICPNLLTTHFTPREAHVTLDQLKALGYQTDMFNEKLTSLDQIIPLKMNDVIISQNSIAIYLRGTKYLDILIKKLYGFPEDYYGAEKFNDLLGCSVFTISPHTSSGILGRIIGYTVNNGLYSHPIVICARRRDADGDIDGVSLLADLFLNGSRTYTEGKVGSLMSVPLNLTLNCYLDEVGKEIHARELYFDYYGGQLNDNTRSYTVQELKSLRRVENYLPVKVIPDEVNGFNTPGFSLNSKNTNNLYRDCENNDLKVDLVLDLEDKLPGVNQSECIIGVIVGHLLPDIIGNLNAYFKQDLKCDSCNKKYTIEPLDLKCLYCKSGVLKLTVFPGMILKYVKLIQKLKTKTTLPMILEDRVNGILDNLSDLFDVKNSIPLKNKLKALLDEE